MKFSLFSAAALLAFASVTFSHSAGFAQTAPMCESSSPSSMESSSELMCSPEQYGFSYDSDGNLIRSHQSSWYDGPSISQGYPSDADHQSPPRSFSDEADIMTGSPLGAVFYGTCVFSGSSHDDAMDWAEFGANVGDFAEGFAGKPNSSPRSYRQQQQQLPNGNSVQHQY